MLARRDILGGNALDQASGDKPLRCSYSCPAPRAALDSADTRSGCMAGGSSGWQAPEQLFSRSGEEVRQGKSVDVFSFGLVLFYCLTGGRHAFGESYERDFNIMQVPPLPSSCKAYQLLQQAQVG